MNLTCKEIKALARYWFGTISYIEVGTRAGGEVNAQTWDDDNDDLDDIIPLRDALKYVRPLPTWELDLYCYGPSGYEIELKSNLGLRLVDGKMECCHDDMTWNPLPNVTT